MFEFSTSVNISLPSFYSAQNPSSLSTGSWPSLLASTHDQNSLYQSCPGTFLPQLQFTEHSQGAELRALAVLNSPTPRKGRSYIICTVTCLRPQSSQWKVAELTTATHYHPSSPSFVTSGHPLQTLTQEVVPGTQPSGVPALRGSQLSRGDQPSGVPAPRGPSPWASLPGACLPRRPSF